MKKRLYIAYGSNLNIEQMASRCPDARVVGAGELKGYRMLFRASGRPGVATVEPCEGRAVPVLVWEISSSDEDSLDIYEGWPNLYRKENLTAELENGPVGTMPYVMNDGRHLSAPSGSYFATIMEGYEVADFDTAVLYKVVAESGLTENCRE